MKMKTELLRYDWFVEPLGDVAYANKVIAEAMDEPPDNPEHLCIGTVCNDGEKHNMWNCPREIATALWKSRRSLHINIMVWYREKGGKIRISFIATKKPKRKPAKKQQAQSSLS